MSFSMKRIKSSYYSSKYRNQVKKGIISLRKESNEIQDDSDNEQKKIDEYITKLDQIEQAKIQKLENYINSFL